MAQAEFAIIVPTAFRIRRRHVQGRALALARQAHFSGQELIISHGAFVDDTRFLRELEAAGARVVVTQLTAPSLPLGQLRNRGAEVATAKQLLFWDVDLAPPQNFLALLRQQLSRNSQLFTIIPCLYASSAGTRQFVRKGEFDIRSALAAFYEHRRDLVQHLALNTSTLLIERSHFLELGGFDERFLDHGLEDLDLLLRLALADDTLPVPTDLLSDERHQSPAFSAGFRSLLNLMSLPVFLDGLATLHQWHRRPRHNDYYGRRRDNWALFEQNALRALGARALGTIGPDWRDVARSDGTLDSLLVVHRLLSRSAQALADPSALFDEVPQHYFHPDRTRRRWLKGLREVLGSKKPR